MPAFYKDKTTGLHLLDYIVLNLYQQNYGLTCQMTLKICQTFLVLSEVFAYGLVPHVNAHIVNTKALINPPLGLGHFSVFLQTDS